MSGKRCRLRGYAFHQVAIADNGIGIVIDDGMARSIEALGQESFGDSHAHAIGKSLP